MRGSRAALLTVSILLVAGCDFFNSDNTLGRTIVLQNESSETIEVLQVRDGVESTLVTLEPGQGHTIAADGYTDRCLPDLLVARLEDGTLVARNDARLCSGDRWEVTSEDGT